MQSFIESLKEVVYEVEQTGGDPLEKLVPSPTMTQRLREYAVQRLREAPDATDGHALHGYLFEEFNEGFFDEGIRVVNIYLARLGITDPADLEDILQRVVDNRLDEHVFRDHGPREQRVDTAEDAIVASAQEVWEEGGSSTSRAYAFARQRLLITWDYRHDRWQTTNLGRFFLELNLFQATCFLLTIDMVLSTGQHDFRHLSQTQLEPLLQPQESRTPHLIPLHRETLQRMGVLRGEDWYDEANLTPVGRAVLEQILSSDNLLRDTAVLLLQSEELGLAYSGFEAEMQRLNDALESPLIDDTNRQSIRNVLALWRQGQFADGLRILFPSIEAIINSLLRSIGEEPARHRGWRSKAEVLAEHDLISADVASALDVIASRNAMLHGDFVPPEPEYALPICQLATMYLRRLLSDAVVPRDSET